jgi:hypothetical protein
VLTYIAPLDNSLHIIKSTLYAFSARDILVVEDSEFPTDETYRHVSVQVRHLLDGSDNLRIENTQY